MDELLYVYVGIYKDKTDQRIDVQLWLWQYERFVGKYRGTCDVSVERARELQIYFYDHLMCKDIENCIVTKRSYS